MPTFNAGKWSPQMAEIQYNTGPLSSPNVRAEDPEKRQLRDEDRVMRNILSENNPDIHANAEAMTRGGVRDAKVREYEQGAWQTKSTEVDYRARQNKFYTDTIRQAVETVDSGNKAGGLYLYRQIDQNKDNPAVSIDKNKTGDFVITRADGTMDTPLNKIKIIEAATSSDVQWNNYQEQVRLHLRESYSTEGTFAKRFGKVLEKRDRYDRYLAQADGDQKKAIELAKSRGDEIQFTNTDLEVMVKGFAGSLMQAGVQGVSNNPSLFNVYSKNKLKGESPEAFIARMQTASITEISNMLKKSYNLPMIGEDVAIPAPGSKDRNTSVGVTVRQNSAAAESNNKPKVEFTTLMNQAVEALTRDKNRLSKETVTEIMKKQGAKEHEIKAVLEKAPK